MGRGNKIRGGSSPDGTWWVTMRAADFSKWGQPRFGEQSRQLLKGAQKNAGAMIVDQLTGHLCYVVPIPQTGRIVVIWEWHPWRPLGRSPQPPRPRHLAGAKAPTGSEPHAGSHGHAPADVSHSFSRGNLRTHLH